jgi:hypothetical protein
MYGEAKENKSEHMRFEVLTAVKMSMLVFWVVTQCRLVCRYRSFGKKKGNTLPPSSGMKM